MKTLISLSIIFLPNALKLFLYRSLYGYKIGKDVKIGFSWIRTGKLEIGDHVRIGHLNVFKNVPDVSIGSYTTIGSGNRFTSSPEFTDHESLKLRGNHPRLIIGEHCGISNSHYFDVQDTFRVGAFTTIAGVRSVFFTHQIDIEEGKQSARPLNIGSYCMIGSNVSMTPGSLIPDCSIVGMASVVTKAFDTPYSLIAGNPAAIKKSIPKDSRYFSRRQGFISSVLTPPFK